MRPATGLLDPEAIVRAVRESPRSKKNWTAFYLYFWRQVAGMSFLLGMRNQCDLEDLCQQVFFRFLRYSPWSGQWETLPSATVVMAYLRVIARNEFYSFFSKRPRQVISFDEISEKEFHALTSQDESLAEVLRSDISLLLKGLSHDDRTLLEHLIAGFSLSEVAKALNISYSAAGVRLHRLRRRLLETM